MYRTDDLKRTGNRLVSIISLSFIYLLTLTFFTLNIVQVLTYVLITLRPSTKPKMRPYAIWNNSIKHSFNLIINGVYCVFWKNRNTLPVNVIYKPIKYFSVSFSEQQKSISLPNFSRKIIVPNYFSPLFANCRCFNNISNKTTSGRSIFSP